MNTPMLKAVNPFLPEGKLFKEKLNYCIRNVERKLCKDLRPDVEHFTDEYILVGESYVHDDWIPVKTSIVLNYNEETKAYETMNSVYRVIE